MQYPDPTKKHLAPTLPMATNQIILEQMDQMADQLISQLFALKETVADLRKKMAEVSTPALGNGLLDDKQVAALLNRREKAINKRYHR